MPKQLKKIKVKKPKKPRQPRRQGVPRKPPVTNISVSIGGGSNQPSGSYYFPNASQSVQPLVSNIFTPAQPEQPRPRVLEEPALQPFDIIPPPMREVVEVGTQTAPRLRVIRNVETQTQSSVPSTPMSLSPLLAGGAAGGGLRGRPIGTGTSVFSVFDQGRTRNMNANEIRDLARGLGVPNINIATGKKFTIPDLKEEITRVKGKQ
jgi:hypothetical protein